MRSIYILTSFLFLVFGIKFLFFQSSSLESKITDQQKKWTESKLKEYRTTILTPSDKDFFPNDWENETFKPEAIEIDSNEKWRALFLLTKEFEKYPEKIIRSYLNSIALSKRLKLFGVGYGGAYIPGRIYVAMSGFKSGYPDEQILKTFHHEFSSLLLLNVSFPFEKWRKAMPTDFSYEKGFKKQLEMISKGMSDESEEKKWFKIGLLNEYGTSTMENDFNIYAETIFTEPEKMKEWIKKYPIVKKKYLLVKKFYLFIDRGFLPIFEKIDG